MREGRIYQINSKPETPGEHGLPKIATQSSYVAVGGLEGDFNRGRHERHNDNPDWAVLLMPIETIEELNSEGWPIKAGDIGENITSQGVAYAAFEPGTKWRIGEAVIQITIPCTPCKNLYLLPYVGDDKGPAFLKTMIDRRGWYARVLKPGRIARTDGIEELVEDASSSV